MPGQSKKDSKEVFIVSEEVGNYEKHPFFIKKTAAAAAFLEKAGLPESSTGKAITKKTANVFISYPAQSVIPHHDGWAVKGSNKVKITRVTATQREAIEAAREIARNQGAEVIIYGKDGKIRHRNRYGKVKASSSKMRKK